MNTLELEYARKKKGMSKADMALLIGKSENSYGKKERGEIRFNDEEKTTVAKKLELSLAQFNAIFFDGELPNG